MDTQPAPTYRVTVSIRTEPLWGHLEFAPLSTRMALEEIGGKDATEDAICGWLRERLRVRVDLARIDIDAAEAIGGVVEMGLREVSINQHHGNGGPQFAGSAELVVRITRGMDERRAAESRLAKFGVGAVELTWLASGLASGSGWQAANANIEFDRAEAVKPDDEDVPQSPEDWFSHARPARRRSGPERPLRIKISVAKADLDGAFAQGEFPRDLKDGCPLISGEPISLEVASKWLAKHLCFEVSVIPESPLVEQLALALEEKRGRDIIQVTSVALFDGRPIVDAETCVDLVCEDGVSVESVGPLGALVRLAWRDGTGSVSEQERYEVCAKSVQVHVSPVRASAAHRPGRRNKRT